MRHAGIGGPFHHRAADRHGHAGKIAVDLALDRFTHEIERDRPLREPDIQGNGRDQHNGENRKNAVRGDLNEPPHCAPDLVSQVPQTSAIPAPPKQWAGSHAHSHPGSLSRAVCHASFATKHGLKRGRGRRTGNILRARYVLSGLMHMLDELEFRAQGNSLTPYLHDMT